MLILLLLAAIWALASLFCLALCIATKRTDALILLDEVLGASSDAFARSRALASSRS
jgi:hypothetical protein